MSQSPLIAAPEATSPYHLGIALSPAGVRTVVVDDFGRLLSRKTVALRPDASASDLAETTADAALQAIRAAGLEAAMIARTGLSSPDPIDPAFADRVACRLGRPLALSAEAEAMARAEHWVGAGREMRSLVLLTLDRDIGCGILVAGKPLSTLHGRGGEAGHLVIDFGDDARPCTCGRRGHLAAYASGAAMVEQARAALAAGRKSSLSAGSLTPGQVADEAHRGDSLATEIVLEAAAFLGVGVVNLMHTIDPDGVLLGGPLCFGGSATELGRRFLERVKEEVRRRAFALLAKRITIDFATLGEDAAALGAAAAE